MTLQDRIRLTGPPGLSFWKSRLFVTTDTILDIPIGSYAIALLFGTYLLGQLAYKMGRRSTLLSVLPRLFATNISFIFTFFYFIFTATSSKGSSEVISKYNLDHKHGFNHGLF